MNSVMAGESSLNIILVSSNLAKTRTITLSWKHYAFAVLVGFVLMVGLTTVLNYGLLRYATAINHPWLQAIILSDQRKEAERAQVYMEEHLAAMALKVGELQGQMLRLDGLGEKLAKIAGLKPQELPAKGGGRICVSTLACSPDAKEANVKIGVADGAWETVRSLSAGGDKLYGSRQQSGPDGRWEVHP